MSTEGIEVMYAAVCEIDVHVGAPSLRSSVARVLADERLRAQAQTDGRAREPMHAQRPLFLPVSVNKNTPFG